VRHPTVLVVSVGSTTGWRASAHELTASLERGGAHVRLASTGPLPRVRTFALTDFVEARAARHVAREAIAGREPDAIVYCSITAALLWPRPGAIWLDSVAAENRPGRHGVWQRVVERRRLREAPLILAMSERALAAAPPVAAEDVVVVPTPVDPSGPPPPARDVLAMTYAGNPEKKRLDHILDAWSHARRDGEHLLVAGIDGIDRGDSVDGVEVTGRLAPEEYRRVLRRTRVFIAAPRREDYGIAPLEALADGCMLVTAPAPGAYPALELARRLDPRLVNENLVPAIRAALDEPSPDYAARAAELLAPFSRAAVDETVRERVLPRLMRI
jgi:hypothetical protein